MLNLVLRKHEIMQKEIQNPLQIPVERTLKEIGTIKRLIVKGQKYEGAKMLVKAEKSMILFAEKMKIYLIDL